jgi:hypothetical protein
MRCHDNVLYDFSLVWTYLPVLIIILRSCVLLGIFYWWVFAVNLPQHGVLMLCASLVYMDSLLMHSNHFDRSCGHLCACALAVLTQHGVALERDCNPTQTVVLMVCDLLWSACASAEVLGRTTGLSVPLSHLSKVVVCCVFASTRVMFSCGAMGLLQIMFRSTLYYILCSLLILCVPLVRQHERGTSNISFQGSSVVYLCLHVLFVHLYAVIASVMIMVGIHARLIYRTLNVRCERDDDNKLPISKLPISKLPISKLPISNFPINRHGESMHGESMHEESTHASSTQSTHSVSGGQGKDYSELVMKLNAAKKANGMG